MEPSPPNFEARSRTQVTYGRWLFAKLILTAMVHPMGSSLGIRAAYGHTTPATLILIPRQPQHTQLISHGQGIPVIRRRVQCQTAPLLQQSTVWNQKARVQPPARGWGTVSTRKQRAMVPFVRGPPRALQGREHAPKQMWTAMSLNNLARLRARVWATRFLRARPEMEPRAAALPPAILGRELALPYQRRVLQIGTSAVKTGTEEPAASTWKA